MNTGKTALCLYIILKLKYIIKLILNNKETAINIFYTIK